MSIVATIDQDLKQALLSRDKELVSVLRGLKSVILYEAVAKNKRDEGLSDQEVITLLQKEAKKRQESAGLYEQGGNAERAAAERAEFEVIQAYLPQMMPEEQIASLVDRVIAGFDDPSPQKMGMVIAEVKDKSEGRADGATIARLVKERLNR